MAFGSDIRLAASGILWRDFAAFNLEAPASQTS
jgi:hypothetical protein